MSEDITVNVSQVDEEVTILVGDDPEHIQVAVTELAEGVTITVEEPAGPAGADGPQGPIGPAGPAGADGAIGPQGIQGEQGPAGPAGPAGADGAQGIQGPAGADGPQGIQGIQGEQGPAGPAGADGAQGIQGEEGPAGPSAVSTDANNAATLGGDGLIYVPSDFMPESEVEAIAAGSTLGLDQALLANAGQPGKTVLAVGFVSTSGKVQGVSLGAGNVVEVYANGADFNAGTVLYREFMSLGEPICFTGLAIGAIITSTQGFYGFAEQVDGSDVSPMPLLSYGLSFKSTFFYGFRNSSNYDPGGTVSNQGWVHVIAGPLKTLVTLKRGDGTIVQGQQAIEVQPWSYLRLYTNADTEYLLEATNPIMACVHANMDTNPLGRFYDSRLIMPLTNDGITWPRSGFVSAPYDNTLVNYYVRDAAKGNFTVSPGTPVDFDAATGASDSDYEPDGATRVLAVGLISAYSGADSSGLEASPLMPTSAMSQVVAQPLFIEDAGDGGTSGISIASPYEGTAKVYQWNLTTSTLELAYTVPLLRNGVTVTTRDDQNHPAAGQVANEVTVGSVELVGDLNPGVVIADVPITIVTQSGPNTWPNLRSQNGTTTSPIESNADETLSLGVTPPELKAEIIEGADGLLYRREVSAGVASFIQS